MLVSRIGDRRRLERAWLSWRLWLGERRELRAEAQLEDRDQLVQEREVLLGERQALAGELQVRGSGQEKGRGCRQGGGLDLWTGTSW